MNCKVTASIVLYQNDRDVLLKCIESILGYPCLSILYLIDNSPTRDLDNLIQHEKVVYVYNPSNPGFGAAHNIALVKAIGNDAEYHLVLNPDVYFEQGTMESLVEFMDKNREVGQVMPKILYPDHSFQYLCKTNPTFFDLFARGFMPAFVKKVLKKRLDKYEYRDKNLEDIIYDIPYLSGCFMLFRIDVLKKIGLFDDRIFMYLEDADITRRVLQMARTAYLPTAFIYHYYAGLTHKKWKYKWITIKSAVTYFNKWGWIKSIF